MILHLHTLKDCMQSFILPCLFSMTLMACNNTTNTSTENSNSTPTKDSVQLVTTPNFSQERFVAIPKGTFLMGSTDGYEEEKPQHTVTVDSFYISKYEVTQEEWQEIMGKDPSQFKCPTCPVERVSFEDVKSFLKKLNAKTSKKFRLPTEAEWEYAAKGGAKTQNFPYSGSDDLRAVAWLQANAAQKTHPIAQKKPNELGLYDMSGNVWEWCSDWYDEKYYQKKVANNPKGAASGKYRVTKGGAWNSSSAVYCRSAVRSNYTPQLAVNCIGLRLATSTW